MRPSSFCAVALLAAAAAGRAPADDRTPSSPSKKSLPLSSSPAASAPIDGKTLTKERLLALPDGAVVQIKGKTFTVRELKSLAARSAAKRTSIEALKPKAKSDVAALQSAFRSREVSRIARANAQLAGQFAGAHRALAKVEPGIVALAAPQITSIAGNAEPGAALYVQGKFFGSGTDGGTVLLKGLPGGDRRLGFDPSYLFPWEPTGIAVVVPDITGVADQTVSIVVVRKDGGTSAPRPIPFSAIREIQSAFPNRVVRCGDDATENGCLAYDFFDGVHIENTLWEVDAADCDDFEATVKPPWEFEEFKISDESDGGRIGRPSPTRSGNVYIWRVCWTVNGAGPYSGNQAKYLGFMMIKGPKGVPSS